MPVIYESPRGRVTMGWLGGYTVTRPRDIIPRKLPPWLKSRTTWLFAELKARGHDASRDPAAAAALWEYVIDSLSTGPLGQAAAAQEPVDEVLAMMLAGLTGQRD